MELQIEIQEALESNMMLETVEEASAENSDAEKLDENNPEENLLDTTQETTSQAEPGGYSR